LRWIGDTLAFEHFLVTRSPRHVVIVGGGYIGLEMSEALTHRGIRVTIIEMTSSVMTTIDPDLGSKVGDELRRNGVCVLTGLPISSIVSDGERLRIQGDKGLSETADMILVAVGARPETDIAAAAGVNQGFGGALKVNRRMQTNVPDFSRLAIVSRRGTALRKAMLTCRSVRPRTSRDVSRVKMPLAVTAYSRAALVRNRFVFSIMWWHGPASMIGMRRPRDFIPYPWSPCTGITRCTTPALGK
jgi:hypothetical protein